MNKQESIMEIKQLSMNELKDAFFYCFLSFYFSSLCERLKHLFNKSIEIVILPDDLKITKVTPPKSLSNLQGRQ